MKIKVSVAVITYNSSATILQTLDSILKQSCGPENIELIISDDCSTDSSISTIEAWLNKYHSNFLTVQLLKSEENKGVPQNCNLAWQACSQEWIKTIAGDDLLMPNCLEMLLAYVENKNDIKWLFSDMIKFSENSILNNHYPYKAFFEMQAKEQFRHLIIGNFINAPSSFINRMALKQIGYADEKYKLIEDYPLWLKVTANNQKLDYIDGKLVRYRIGESISRSKTKIINEKFFLLESLVRRDYIDVHSNVYDWLYWLCKWDHVINNCILRILSKKELNEKKSLGFIVYVALLLFSPLRYIRKIRYIIHSRL